MDTNDTGKQYSSESFISQLKKYKLLNDNKVYTDEEYITKKNALISDLIDKGIMQNVDDFLAETLILKDKNILNLGELRVLKESLVTSKKVNGQNVIRNDAIIKKHQPSTFQILSGLVFLCGLSIIVYSFIVDTRTEWTSRSYDEFARTQMKMLYVGIFVSIVSVIAFVGATINNKSVK